MHYYADAVSQTYTGQNFADVAPYDPREAAQKARDESTGFVTRSAAIFDFFKVTTATLATANPIAASVPSKAVGTQTLKDSAVPVAPVIEGAAGAEIEKIARQRVQLMAAKYARSNEKHTRSNDMSEIVARLEILNHRLLVRAPRVSVEQVAALERVGDQLTKLRTAREEQALRLGIKL